MINARVPMLLNSRPALNVAPCPPDLHAMSITLLGTPHRGPVQDALRETASCVGLKPHTSDSLSGVARLFRQAQDDTSEALGLRHERERRVVCDMHSPPDPDIQTSTACFCSI